MLRALPSFVFVYVFILSSYGDLATAQDWPQWRGANRDSQAEDEAWPDSIGEDNLKLRWRVELGPSYSGPIVIGDRVFTTETRDEKVEVASAYDLKTGDQLWETEWEGAMEVPFFAASNGSWIRATPAADEKNLYVVGIRDVLVALDQTSGDEQWRIDFPEQTGSSVPKFGGASSPMLDKGELFAQIGDGFAKIDKSNGDILWHTAKNPGGMMGGAFSSPYMSEVDGKRVALVQGRDNLMAIDPESGDVAWSHPIEAFRGMNILTPIVYNNRLFTSAHSGRSQLWQVSTTAEDGIEEVWQNKSQAYMSSPVVIGKYLYMHLKNQRVQCLDLESGEEMWRTKPFGKYQSMVVQGNKILSLDEGGELLLINATPEKFDLTEKRQISDQETWAHLAVCRGVVIVRELNALSVYDWQ